MGQNKKNYKTIYHVIISGFIYGCESCMVLAHDEVHVVNVVNEDKSCRIQVCLLYINLYIFQ